MGWYGGRPADGRGNLIQSGTQQNEYSDFAGHWTATYEAWIEDYPWNPYEVNKFSVNCGDPMYADDWQDYSNGHATAAHMYIEDQKSGQYAESTNTSAFSNGSTAEWIIERNGTNGDLSDFNYINFTDCYAYRNSNPYGPLSLPYNYDTIYYNGHSLVSLGSLLADGTDVGDHFQVVFQHSY